MLGQAARDCDAIMAVSRRRRPAALGVRHARRRCAQAETIGFVEGSNWDERLAGTNAPGLALAPRPVASTVIARRALPASRCSAGAVRRRRSTTRRPAPLLGVLDVTGGDEIVVPQTMAMVRAAARMAEAELARDLLRPRTPPPESGRPRRSCSSRSAATSRCSRVDDGRGRGRARSGCRPRHSEILLLLASAPRGLSGDELAVLLYEDDGASSTLRAELNRLRGLLGDDLLASRPYRLTAAVTGDWLAVEAQLAAGDVRRALRGYRGPLLPALDRARRRPAPRRARGARSAHARAALAASADLMSAWTRSSWGARRLRDVGRAARRPSAAASPMRPLVDGQIARLDRELA